MKGFIEVRAVRNYDVQNSGMGRCDLCKRMGIFTYILIPEESLHNFDNIFLCKTCITKCGFDIREGVLNGLNDDERGNNNCSQTMEQNQD